MNSFLAYIFLMTLMFSFATGLYYSLKAIRLI